MPKIIRHLRHARPLTITGLFALAAALLLAFFVTDAPREARASNPAIQIGFSLELGPLAVGHQFGGTVPIPTYATSFTFDVSIIGVDCSI